MRNGKPVIGAAEPKDEHNKFYSEKTVKAAIEAFQKREGIPSYSLACRAIILAGFENERIFGGYDIE